MKLNATVRKKPRIEMIPLIDVVFLLLVFFIYSMLSMSYHSVIPVTLPEALTGQKPGTEKPLVIGINAQGNIIIQGKSVTQEELGDLLKDAAEHQTPVYIAGDEDSRYKELIWVCDEIRKAGISDFSFRVAEEK